MKANNADGSLLVSFLKKSGSKFHWPNGADEDSISHQQVFATDICVNETGKHYLVLSFEVLGRSFSSFKKRLRVLEIMSEVSINNIFRYVTKELLPLCATTHITEL